MSQNPPSPPQLSHFGQTVYGAGDHIRHLAVRTAKELIEGSLLRATDVATNEQNIDKQQLQFLGKAILGCLLGFAALALAGAITEVLEQ